MQTEHLNQALSLAGAACILAGYVGHQLEWLDSEGAAYNVINAIGASILGYVALHPFQIGFVILEFVWVFVSLVGLLKTQARKVRSAR